MCKLLIGVLLVIGPTVACADYPPFQGPYSEPDSNMVDALASSAAWLPALFAIGACGVVTLPADVYWKVKRPQEALGSHVGERVCGYPGVAVAYPVYLIAGFPLFAVKKVTWDLPRALFKPPPSQYQTEIRRLIRSGDRNSS